MIEGKRLYLDTNAIIAFVERVNDPSGAVLNVFVKASELQIELVTSELTLAEVLVKPLRDRQANLIETCRALIGKSKDVLRTISLSIEILEKAAALRAQHSGLKLPVALHLATAMAIGCSLIVSADQRLKTAAGIAVVDFDELKALMIERAP